MLMLSNSKGGTPKQNEDCVHSMDTAPVLAHSLGISIGFLLEDVILRLFNMMFVVGIMLFRRMLDILKR